MTQECARDANISTARSFDPQACGPLSESETRKSRNDSEVDDRHEDGEQDSGSLCGISGRTRATAEHTRDERTQDQEGNEGDVVD
jgi:hypothetical protein